MTRRCAFQIRGLVQGVGFRPFVYRLASELGLAGFVRNQGSHVLVELEGDAAAIDAFPRLLREKLPPLARIDQIISHARPLRGEESFAIITSAADADAHISVPPDVATCRDCLAELLDPGNRRYRYPFLNCTNCGPRLTIITDVPYDRANTTMARFVMCDACRREYEDPTNRRFHAEPTACPACGPQLRLTDAAGQPLDGDPLAGAVEALRGGNIVAVKGLGGYHLACLARDDSAVVRLRRRKHRDEKPFAIMVRDLAAAQSLCEVAPEEAALLTDPRTPIVLLRRRPDAPENPCVAPSVAPGNPLLGVMLPYTPLHHLLMHEIDEPLVMTSGNRSEEPIAHDDADARERLGGIADCFLTHDRPIHRRCDDSIVRWCGQDVMMLRRSRGYVPAPVWLTADCPAPVLAVGGQLKATFALCTGRQVILSHHSGDLDDYAAFRAYLGAIDEFERFFDVRPQLIVHDLHPDYASTRYAQQRSRREGTPLLAVQHHHAHLASCLAENGIDAAAIGVIFDGTGYGTDGAVWGGEFLVGDARGYRRAAHFRYVCMPGGEQAIREPWRMAAAHLLDAGCDLAPLATVIEPEKLQVVEQMIDRRLNAPLTSSAGRLFDAVAALAGVRHVVSYEGQAAIELEWLATGQAVSGEYPYAIDTGEADERGNPPPLIIDTRPLIAGVRDDLATGMTPASIARRFHSTLVSIICNVCRRLREQTGLDAVALSGGVFLNALILEESLVRLQEEGFRVYRQREVPPGDGGLSLGQIAVAAAHLRAAAAP